MEKHLTIGNSSIPALGLGTWAMSGKECADTVAAAINIGYRHLDTAQNYGNEAEVGEGIKKSNTAREELFVTTKVSTRNLEPGLLARAAGESLKLLKTDYIDLLLIHWPTSDMILEETLDAMFRLKEEGKIRHVGVSNFSPSLFRKALGLGPVICNQVEFSPYKKQDENLAIAREHNVMITAYTPLAQGKVSRDIRIREIAKSYEKTAAQVTLRWLLQKGNLSVIPKASSITHLKENLEIFDFELSGEDMEKMSAIRY
jgi:2,5-diketo-D-gluconate reductase B